MTRAELIAELMLPANPHLRQADAELVVATIFDQITAALARGERVELRGFGAFSVRNGPPARGTIRGQARQWHGEREGGAAFPSRPAGRCTAGSIVVR